MDLFFASQETIAFTMEELTVEKPNRKGHERFNHRGLKEFEDPVAIPQNLTEEEFRTWRDEQRKSRPYWESYPKGQAYDS